MTPLATAALLLVALWGAARLGGAAFGRLRQPRVVGELLAGAALGPAVLGALWPEASVAVTRALRDDLAAGVALDLAHHVGLVGLMFLSGARMRGLLGPEDRRAVAWLAGVGTALPFVVALALAPVLPLARLEGPAGSRPALVLVLGVAAAVTSIPVISRIFRDLGLLETRFARLVLGVAVVEDVALWAVLAAAVSLAAATDVSWAALALDLARTAAYVGAALALGPALVRRLERGRLAAPIERAPLAWLALVLAAHGLAGAACGVGPVFAAFFAGLSLDGGGPAVRGRLDRLERVGYAAPIPVYFALVGLRLDLGPGLDLGLAALLLVGACAVKLAAVGLGALLAGFRGLDVVNLAVATNARGGPGIVLASVALAAGIVNPLGYTSLVLLAVVSSQAAGAWLEHLVRRGRPLLAHAPGSRDVGPAGPPDEGRG